MDLNKLSKEIHEEAKAKGFYDEPREDGTLLMLIISELSEALEAHRKNKRCIHLDLTIKDCQILIRKYDDKEMDCLTAFKSLFELYIKDTVEDELADAMIRILDFAGYKKIKLYQMNNAVKWSYDPKLEFGCKLYIIVQELIESRNNGSTFYGLRYVFTYLIELCEQMNIYWQTHIALKRRYNKLREYKHGKEY